MLFFNGSLQCLGYGIDDQGSIPSTGNKGTLFLFVTTSRLTLRPTQPSIHWVLAAFPQK